MRQAILYHPPRAAVFVRGAVRGGIQERLDLRRAGEQALGLEHLDQKKMRTADGASHDVDYVVKDGQAEVGVKVDRKTEKVTLIPKDCDAGPGKVWFRSTPPWPSSTDQFGDYYIRGPW